MKASQFYGSRFLNADDLDQTGRELTIVGVGSEVFRENGGTTREKLTLEFAEEEKGIVLNATNAEKVIELLGDETDDWLGAKVRIARGWTKFQGKRTPGVVITGAEKPKKEKPGAGK